MLVKEGDSQGLLKPGAEHERDCVGRRAVQMRANKGWPFRAILLLNFAIEGRGGEAVILKMLKRASGQWVS